MSNLVPIDEARQLVLIDDAHRALAEARTVSEKKAVRDWAETLRISLLKRGYHGKVHLYIAVLKLQAERECGALLAENILHQGGRPGKLSNHTTVLPPDVTRDQSSHWQKLASVPEKVFRKEAALILAASASAQESTLKQAEAKATTAHFLRLARERVREGYAAEGRTDGR